MEYPMQSYVIGQMKSTVAAGTAGGSDQAIILIFIEYLPKSTYSEVLEPHFEDQKPSCKV